ncbi:unnamed protein product [Amoebophrya sp. A25]|nr:unnamed protein product [Amoebophrya sp. A25]|eukprot:GSA25T00008573001.1
MAAEHPELRNLVSMGKKAAWVRHRCVRVLLGPLFPSMNSIDSPEHLNIDDFRDKARKIGAALVNKKNMMMGKYTYKKSTHSGSGTSCKQTPVLEKTGAKQDRKSVSSFADFKAKGNQLFQKRHFTDAADQFHLGQQCFSKITNPTFAEVFDGVACSANAANAYLHGNAYIGKNEVKPNCYNTTRTWQNKQPKMNITMFDMKAHEAATTAIDTADKYLNLWARETSTKDKENISVPTESDISRLETLKMKALFRRGQATLGMKEAVSDLKMADEIAQGEDTKVQDMLRLAEEMEEVNRPL